MLALLFLIAAQESLADKAVRLAKDPKANRDELLKLGTGAIRPLLELKEAALDPVLKELRLSGAPADFIQIDQIDGCKLREPMPIGEVLRGTTWVDPIVAGRGVPGGSYQGNRTDFTASVCRAADVEYRYVRGHLVASTAERLWAWPAPTKVEADALKKAAAQLDDAAPETRDTAARLLLSAGEASLPFLDASDAEAAGVAARIRARYAPPVFVETLFLERQELDDAGKAVLKMLRETKAPIDFHGYAVADAMQILFEKSDVKWSVAKAANVTVSSCGVRESAVIDAIWWLTVPYGLDAGLKDGKLVIDTRENVAKIR